MANILGLDPNKFKHISSDDKSTTLRHPAGHTITIAHNAVSPKIKTQLEAMANAQKQDNAYGKIIQKAHGGITEMDNGPFNYQKGGKMQIAHTAAPIGSMSTGVMPSPGTVGEGSAAKGGKVSQSGIHNQAQGEKRGMSSSGESLRNQEPETAKMIHENKLQELRKMPNPKLKGLAKGGPTSKVKQMSQERAEFADGGMAVSGPSHAEGETVPGAEYAYEHGLPCLNPNCKSHGRPHPNCRCYGGGGEYGRFAEGGSVQYCAYGKPHKKDCEYYKEGGSVMPKELGAYDEGGTVDRDKNGPGGISKGTAQGLSEGASQPGSISEGVENVKNEVSSWFKAKGGKVKAYADPEGPVSKEDTAPMIDESGGVQTPQAISPGMGSILGDLIKHTAHSISKSANAPYLPQETQTQPAQSTPPDANQQAPLPDQSQAQAAPVQDQNSQNTDQTQSDQDQDQQPQAQPASQSPGVNNQEQSPDQNKSGNMPEYDQAVAGPTTDMSDEAKQHALAFQEDLRNGHITPKTFSSLMHDKGVLGRIGTIFGLMVGGAGAAMAHQTPALAEMMQKQIDNDLKAQDQSKANAQNLLRLNQQYIANQANVGLTEAQKHALAITNAQNDAMSGAFNSLSNITNKIPAGTPLRQQADQTLGLLYQTMQGKIQNSAAALKGMQALGNVMNPGQNSGDADQAFAARNRGMIASGDPNLARIANVESARHLSGVPEVQGQLANRDIPEDKRNQVLAMQTLDNKGKDILNFIKQHSGTLNPQQRAVATQKIEEMKNFYNNSIAGGALTEGRLGWYDEQFKKNPTDILPQLLGNTKKLQEVVNSNNTRKNLLLNSLGFKPSQSQSTEIRYDKQGNAWKLGPNGKPVRANGG